MAKSFTLAYRPGCDPARTEVVAVGDIDLGHDIFPSDWVLYVHSPASGVDDDAIDTIALCTLMDGRRVVGMLHRSASPGLWNVHGPGFRLMFDLELRNAVRVRAAMPGDLARAGGSQ